MTAFLARTACHSRAYCHVAAGAFLPGGRTAIVACTDGTLQLLVAQQGAQDGEGHLEVVCEQPLFATVQAVARLPVSAMSGQQDFLALLTDSGCLSILCFDAGCIRFVALQQLPLAREVPGDPFRLLTVHQQGLAVAVASLGGSLCLAVRQEAAAAAASGAGGLRFHSPYQLTLNSNLWSLVFTEAKPAVAPQQHGHLAAAAAGAEVRLTLTALHQRTLDGSFATVEYSCSAAAVSGQLSGLQIAGWRSLHGGGGLLGCPRSLVQLPPRFESHLEGQKQQQEGKEGIRDACWTAEVPNLVLREHSLEIAAGRISGGGELQARHWLQQQEPVPPVGAAMAAAAGGSGAHAVVGEPESLVPMAVPYEPSGEQLMEAEEAEAVPMADATMWAPALAAPERLLGQDLAEGDVPSSDGEGAAARGTARRGLFITCCCWEWQARVAGHSAQSVPVLVCALENGCLCTLRVACGPRAGAGDSTMLVPQPVLQHQRLAQPARSLAALPGGLLVVCTDSGAAVADCQLADLEGTSQQQLYAVCHSTGGGCSSGGSLCVLYPDPKPEVAFELPGAAEGIIGLWGIRRCSADPHHSFTLLSYVGGSRLLASQGGVFRDVTESYSLQADVQTLAAGNLAAAGTTAVAQVTSHGVVLFTTVAGAPEAGDLSQQRSSGNGTSRGSWSYAWQPPAGSSIGAAAVADQAVLLFCTGSSSRHLVVLLPDPVALEVEQQKCGGQAGQPTPPRGLVQAAVLPMVAEVSCISNLLQQEEQRGVAVFAVGTYGSTVLLVQLQWGLQLLHQGQGQRQDATLRLLHLIDLTSTSAASSLPPAAALAATATPLSPRSFQREQLTPESLLLLPAEACGGGNSGTRSSKGSSAASEAASVLVGLRIGGILQLSCSWGSAQQEQEELLSVSLGHMPVVLLPLPLHQPTAAAAVAGVAPPAAVILSDRMSLLYHRPAAAAAAASARVIGVGGCNGGGRVRCQQLALPQVQAATALLLDSGGLGGSSIMLDAMATTYEQQEQQQQQQQLFMLCAAADGCLRMVSLDPEQLVASRCWPLPQHLQPSRLAVHTASSSVVVAGVEQAWSWQAWEAEEGQQAAIQVLDPATGERMASFSAFHPGERITALAVWDPTTVHQQQQAAAGSSGAAGPGRCTVKEKGDAVTALAHTVTADEAFLGGFLNGGSLRSHPIAFSPNSTVAATMAAAGVAESAAAAAASGDERPWGGFIVVGTSISSDSGGEKGGKGDKQWDDESSLTLQGRLLLLQLATATAASTGGSRAAAAWQESLPWQEQQAPHRQLQLLAVAELLLPSRVLALCPGSSTSSGGSSSSGSSGSCGGGGGSRLFAAVGRRLVAFEWRQRQHLLRRVTWVPTNRPICSLRISRSLLVAADRGEGVTLYRYYEPPPGGLRGSLQQQRSSLTRRLRLAPPGTAELRHRMGVQPQPGGQGGAGAVGAGRQLLPEGEDEEEPGFQVVAADSACRPAVGAVALAPTASGGGGIGSTAAAAAAAGHRPAQGAGAAAVVLDAHGQVTVLQQRWPQHEPALQERCRFALGEPAVALLPGSLAYEGDGTGPSASSSSTYGLAAASAAAGAPGSTAQAGAEGMVAVTAGGAAIALIPLEQQLACLLLDLQHALAQHPVAAPLSGSSYAAFRAGSGSLEREVFHHPPPQGTLDAHDLAPHSPHPSTPTAQDVAAGLGGSLLVSASPVAPEDKSAGGDMAADQQPGGGAAMPVASPVGAQRAQAPPVPLDVVLDAELLQHYLLLSPLQQRQLVAVHFIDCGGSEAAVRRLASQLNNLLVQLLL